MLQELGEKSNLKLNYSQQGTEVVDDSSVVLTLIQHEEVQPRVPGNGCTGLVTAGTLLLDCIFIIPVSLHEIRCRHDNIVWINLAES